jgi:hypothetical protein
MFLYFLMVSSVGAWRSLASAPVLGAGAPSHFPQSNTSKMATIAGSATKTRHHWPAVTKRLFRVTV